MRQLRYFFLAILTLRVAAANEIAFFSQGSAADPNEWNSSGRPTIPIAPHQYWSTAQTGSYWVSHEITGLQGGTGYVVVPNGTVISFMEDLFVPWIPTAAWITIMADDSVTLVVNGVAVVEEALRAGNAYWICSDAAVGCRPETALTVDLRQYLVMGNNQLRFDVVQRGWYSYGLNYAGVISGLAADEITQTPEPASHLIFLSTSLLVFTLHRRNTIRCSSS